MQSIRFKLFGSNAKAGISCFLYAHSKDAVVKLVVFAANAEKIKKKKKKKKKNTVASYIRKDRKQRTSLVQVHKKFIFYMLTLI